MQFGKYHSINENRELRKIPVGRNTNWKTNRKQHVEYNSETMLRNNRIENYIRNRQIGRIQIGRHQTLHTIWKIKLKRCKSGNTHRQITNRRSDIAKYKQEETDQRKTGNTRRKLHVGIYKLKNRSHRNKNRQKNNREALHYIPRFLVEPYKM